MGTVTVWVPELSFHTSWYLVLNLPLWGGVKPTRIVRSSLGFTGRPGSTAASARNGPPGPETDVIRCGTALPFVIVISRGTLMLAGTQLRNWPWSPTSANWTAGA